MSQQEDMWGYRRPLAAKPLLPPPPLYPHMSPKVLPRTSVISADHRLSSYPCNYILPWQERNLAIKAPFHLCLLHLACCGHRARGETACRSERLQGLHGTPVLALAWYELGRWTGASNPDSTLKEYEHLNVLSTSHCSVRDSPLYLWFLRCSSGKGAYRALRQMYIVRWPQA